MSGISASTRAMAASTTSTICAPAASASARAPAGHNVMDRSSYINVPKDIAWDTAMAVQVSSVEHAAPASPAVDISANTCPSRNRTLMRLTKACFWE